MEKRKEVEDPNSCPNKADVEEPIFTLRGQDVLAPMLVRTWARMAELLGCGEKKVAEARALADRMDAWHKHKNPD